MITDPDDWDVTPERMDERLQLEALLEDLFHLFSCVSDHGAAEASHTHSEHQLTFRWR